MGEPARIYVEEAYDNPEKRRKDAWLWFNKLIPERPFEESKYQEWGEEEKISQFIKITSQSEEHISIYGLSELYKSIFEAVPMFTSICMSIPAFTPGEDFIIIDTIPKTRLFPTIEWTDVSQEKYCQVLSKPAFITNLISAIMDQPVEDGYFHPGEEILKKALVEEKQSFGKWMIWLVKKEPNSSLAADIVKLAGRLEASENQPWYLELAKIALSHSEVEVRDAGVQALELWATVEAVNLLKGHNDSSPWLKEYIERIIKQMS